MKKSDVLKSLERDKNGRIFLDSLKADVDYKIELEDKGKRFKRWIKFSDKRYLVKDIKDDTYEDYAELLVEELCKQLGIPCAHNDLAIYNGNPCVISENFIKSPREKMESGKTFLSGTVQILIDNGLYKRKQKGDQKELNNLEMVERCLSVYLPEEILKEEMKKFDMLFALNCFCLNGDIHLSNWSVIKDYSAVPTFRLAPNYDFGSYFRFSLIKSNIFKHLRDLLRQKKSENVSKILEDQIFGKDYNRHNSLNFKYSSTDELGLIRLEEAYKEQPERFSLIVQKLYQLDPYEAVSNVKKKLGGADIPEDCVNWFIAVIEANQKRLSEMVNRIYFPRKEENKYAL